MHRGRVAGAAREEDEDNSGRLQEGEREDPVFEKGEYP